MAPFSGRRSATGQPEALPDGLCRPCRAAHSESDGTPAVGPAEIAGVKAHMANLRGLLKTPESS
ncbi:hypothetical protein YW5DRAFT_05568 [Streptomyces sp. Ncost-T6T-1]|nr:hypothetical protein YW5DRAFT_05568 [Streptomyces sp. Ncost-T6T-1]